MAESDETQIALIQKDLGYIKKSIDVLDGRLTDWQKQFVTKSEFWPIKTIVYSGTGIVLMTVFGALIAQVIKK